MPTDGAVEVPTLDHQEDPPAEIGPMMGQERGGDAGGYKDCPTRAVKEKGL